MKTKISLLLAILININIVIGGGFFFSIISISQKVGVFAALSWLTIGALLLPLALVLADLSNEYPVSGGLYVFSNKILGPTWGLLSGWGYYLGTAAGNAVVIHAFSQLIYSMGLIPFGLSGLWLDVIFVLFFAIINLFNIELLGKVQTFFTTLKAIPFALVLFASLFLFKSTNIAKSPPFDLMAVLKSIPLVLFAYIGIEACCAIGHIIEDGKKNTSRAILISFAIIIAIYSITQFLIVGIHGNVVGNPFSMIIPQLTSNPTLIYIGTFLVEFAILSSFLGGFYSMFYTNNWNLFSIAKEEKAPFSKSLLSLNAYQAPTICIVTQAGLILGLLALINDIESIVVVSDFGIVIAYLLSTVAFLAIRYKSGLSKLAIGLLSLASCGYLLLVCVENLAFFFVLKY